MKKLFVVSCFFAKSKEKELENSSIFANWFYQDDTTKKFLELGFPRSQIEELQSMRDKPDEYKGLKTESVGMTPKGIAIRNKFRKINPRDHDTFVLYIDGDGQIPFDNLFKLLKALLCEEQYATANRINTKGIDEPRAMIEKFELFLISEKYNVELPDGQCGCWGLRCDVLNSIAMTAEEFEIELDILINCLEHHIEPVFVKVDDIQEDDSSTFKKHAHLTKLKFLMNKLYIDGYVLKAKYDKFKDEHGGLPEEYLELFKETGISSFPKKRAKII